MEDSKYEYNAVLSRDKVVVSKDDDFKKQEEISRKNFLNKMKKIEEEKRQRELIDDEPSVFAVPCDIPWVVDPEKAKEFNELKPDPELWKKVEEALKNLNIKDETVKGPVLRKIKIKQR